MDLLGHYFCLYKLCFLFLVTVAVIGLCRAGLLSRVLVHALSFLSVFPCHCKRECRKECTSLSLHKCISTLLNSTFKHLNPKKVLTLISFIMIISYYYYTYGIYVTWGNLAKQTKSIIKQPLQMKNRNCTLQNTNFHAIYNLNTFLFSYILIFPFYVNFLKQKR